MMQSQFCERIRLFKGKQHLYLRQVTSLFELDTAQLSKIEKGMRQLKREQIPIIAEILKASSDELMTLWLADQIYAVVKDEKLANEAMQVAEKNINQKKARNKTNNLKVII
jgi:transcriptional regulator with XRE-family HTH domain